MQSGNRKAGLSVMNKKIIGLAGITALIILAYILYDDYTYKKALKPVVGEEIKEQGLNRWSYNFIQSLTSQFTNQTLTTSARISKAREIMNENYTNFVNSLDFKANNTNIDIAVLTSKSLVLNLVETVYSILKGGVPEEEPLAPASELDYESLDKILLIKFSLVQASVNAIFINTIVSENDKFCRNQSEYNKCMKDMISLFENVAQTEKNNLREYREVSLPACLGTTTYRNVKKAEKNLREQLTKTKDVFSILWKSIQIDMYEKCSDKLYETIKDNPCGLIIGKSSSLNIVLATNALFSSCSGSYLVDKVNNIKGKLIL